MKDYIILPKAKAYIVRACITKLGEVKDRPKFEVHKLRRAHKIDPYRDILHISTKRRVPRKSKTCLITQIKNAKTSKWLLLREDFTMG